MFATFRCISQRRFSLFILSSLSLKMIYVLSLTVARRSVSQDWSMLELLFVSFLQRSILVHPTLIINIFNEEFINLGVCLILYCIFLFPKLLTQTTAYEEWNILFRVCSRWWLTSFAMNLNFNGLVFNEGKSKSTLMPNSMSKPKLGMKNCKTISTLVSNSMPNFVCDFSNLNSR